MRMIAATLRDVYHVHKTLHEYAADTGTPPLTDSLALADQLSNDKHRFVLLMHGKKSVGMIWGREDEGAFLIQGKFLKRAFRGKFKFTRELAVAKLEIIKGYDTVRERIPSKRVLGKRQVAYMII